MAKESAAGSNDFEPPKYVASLIAAINDGAKAAQAGMLLYLLVGLYLLATAFSSSDEDLLLGKAVVISQIGASLPVTFSFAIAPLVFVFLHIYTLTRYDMLAANLRHFSRELRETVVSKWDRERCRQLLANVEFIQVLTAPRESTLYNWAWRWMVRLLLAILPVTVLLLVQINALRYQSDSIAVVQRVWLVADLGALVWFFYRNALTSREPRSRSWRFRAARLTGLALLAALVLAPTFVWVRVVTADEDARIVRYDGGSLKGAFGRDRDEDWLKGRHPRLANLVAVSGQTLQQTLRDHPWLASLDDAVQQPLDTLACPELGWGCRYLRVERRTLVQHVWDDKRMADLRADGADRAKALTAIEGVQLRERNLRFAVLTESRLYAGDMVGADLRQANLYSADLSGAKLFGETTQLAGADLSYARLAGADLVGARLAGANLAGANLSGARLAGANLIAAWLTGADLRNARAWHFVSSDQTTFALADLRNIDFATAPDNKEKQDALDAIAAIPDPDRRKRIETHLQMIFSAGNTDWHLTMSRQQQPALVSQALYDAQPAFRSWLITEPDMDYRTALADLLVGTIAPDYSEAAEAFANRAQYSLPRADRDARKWPADLVVACQLLAAAGATPPLVILKPDRRNELSAAITASKQKCPETAGGR